MFHYEAKNKILHLNCAECAKICSVTYGTHHYHTKKSKTELSTYSFVCSKYCRSLTTDRRETKRKTDHATKKAVKKAAMITAKENKIIKGPINDTNSKSILAQNCLNIIEKRKNGQTLKEIGDEYDVTRERIRQFILPYNIPIPLKPQKEYNCAHCGKNINTKRKYCNKECLYLEIHSGKKYSNQDYVNLTCDGCGETFNRSKRLHSISLASSIYRNPEKLTNKQNFCTKECYCQTKLGNKQGGCQVYFNRE